MAGGRRRARRAARTLAVVLLSVLAALPPGLLAWNALQGSALFAARTATSTPADPGPSAPALADVEGSPPPGGSPQAEAGPPAAADGAPQVLVAYAGELALRAVPGSCERGDGRLERSADGGRTWAPVPPPTPALLRVGIAEEGSLAVLGVGDGCSPRSARSDDQGASWVPADDAAWYVLRDDARRLLAPAGPAASPCRTTSRIDPVAPDAAVLLCSSGSVYRSEDGGRTYSRRQGAERAVALDFLDPETGWIAVPGGRCGSGTEVLATEDGSLTWQPRGCVDVAADDPAGVAFADEANGLLVAGTETHATTDGGRTWQQRS